jgi:site-specific DNA-methyltransferase (adenine-specific)
MSKQAHGIQIVNEDCRTWMASQRPGSIRCVVTSPPYNLGVTYNSYEDGQSRDDYLTWLGQVFKEVGRVLHDEGHFFLNIGYSNTDPWVDLEVAAVAREHFVLQNRITWVKSISIGQETFGHFKPVKSSRFLNATNESVFHLTKTGAMPVDRVAVGVPYKWKSNLDKRSRIRGRLAKRLSYKGWRDFEANASEQDHAKLDAELESRVARLGRVHDRRCRGNTWFIPYDTIRDRDRDRGSHPATFPVALPEMCIRFAGCPPGTLVYDPFVGSGTTMVAARGLGMRGVGTDIDQSYVASAIERLMRLGKHQHAAREVTP